MTNIKNTAFAKRSLILSLLVTFAIAFTMAVPAGLAWANTDGNDSSMRVNDFTGSLSESDESSLSRMVKNEINGLEFDFNVVLSTQGTSTAENAKNFYEHNDCGYGIDDDGIILYINPDTGKASIYTCGLGNEIFSDADKSAIRKAVKKTMKSDYAEAVYLFLNSAVCKVADYRGVSVGSNWSPENAVDEFTVIEDETDASSSSSTGDTTNGGLNPSANASGKTTADLSWYPKDPSKFKDFHNAKSVSRVIDNADLLTDEEEAILAESIADMQERTGLDFVLYTDNSSYGLSRAVYAADFYQFNGYGFGEDYSGVIYFVCMEKGNRGFWTAARGDARELLTEDNVNYMDDRTYDYFVDGEYGTAILTQFSNLDTLYTDGGFPFDWSGVFAGGILAVIIGIINGFVRLLGKRKQMKTIAKQESARRYMQNGGPVFSVKRDHNLGTTVTVTHISHDDDSGGGGGGSSYSGGYSSSGGGSFSGGGRSF